MAKTNHVLKSIPCYFDQVWNGDKPFDIRQCTDRTFQRGDTVELNEYDPAKHVIKEFCYTKRIIRAEISFVTNYKQKEDYVVFGLINIVKQSGCNDPGLA